MLCIDVTAGSDSWELFVFSLKKQLCDSAIVLGTQPLLSYYTSDAAFVVWSPSVRSGWCNGRKEGKLPFKAGFCSVQLSKI